MIAFLLKIIPPTLTSQDAGKRVRIAKIAGKHVPMFYKSKECQQVEDTYHELCYPWRPVEKIAGPVKLSVDFVFPFRESEPKWRRLLGRVFHTSKPDCSNIIKQLEDVLTKLGFWNDDGQICDLHITKAWGDQVGIYVRVVPLEEPQRPVAPPKQPSRKKSSPDQPPLL